MMANTPQLRCVDVSMDYENVPALAHVSFSVAAGAFVCVVGRNGSGKSSLLRGILGLTTFKSGQVLWDGSLRRQQIGYLPQQTQVQKDFPASVWEVVLSGCLNRKGKSPFYPAREKALAGEIMGRLGLGELKKKSYRNLSGGQQQRVLLARALCATEKMLFLDEPAASLDPRMTEEFYQLLAALNREKQVTIFMVTHDLDCCRRFASQIIHLDTRLLFSGSWADYLLTEAGQAWGEGERHD